MNVLPRRGPIASLLQARNPGAGWPPLHPAVQRWRAALPSHLSTRALQQEAPEVLEQLALAWHQAAALDRLLAQCLFQSDRPGLPFSLQALDELTELKRYADRRVHRRQPVLWDVLFDHV